MKDDAAGLEGGGTPRRAYVEIIRDIIRFCLKGKTRTETRRGCRIDTAKMKHYVDESLRAGLLEERRVKVLEKGRRLGGVSAVNRRKLFTTEKGWEYLKAYQHLTGLLSPRFNPVTGEGKPKALNNADETDA